MKFILDTDHTTLFQQGYPVLAQRLALIPAGQIAVTIITYEEQLEGRLALVRRARTTAQRIQAHYWLQRTLDFFCRMPVLPLGEEAAQQFQNLQKQSLRVGTQDLLIAAIALANQATLLTRNLRDFRRIPSLALEDWSVSIS